MCELELKQFFAMSDEMQIDFLRNREEHPCWGIISAAWLKDRCDRPE